MRDDVQHAADRSGAKSSMSRSNRSSRKKKSTRSENRYAGADEEEVASLDPISLDPPSQDPDRQRKRSEKSLRSGS